MTWLKKWLKKWLPHEPKPAPPAHRCHFVRWVSPALPGRLVYRCACGAMYGVGHNGWVHKPAPDLSKY